MRSVFLVTLGVFATSTFLVAAQSQKAVDSVRLPAPAGEKEWQDDQHREQIDGIAVRSDGTYLILDANLKNKLTTHAGTEVRAYVDTDNNPATGATDKSGKHAGFEYLVDVQACIDDFHGGATCSGREPKPKGYHGLAEVNRYKTGNPSDTDRIRQFYDAVQSPSDGKMVQGKIAYADLNVKSGQTIRLSVCTASVFHDYAFFPDIVLKLK